MRALTGLLIFALSLTHATANGPREDAAASIITGLERSMAFDGGWWREGSDIRTAAGIVATAADVAAITNRADVLAIVAVEESAQAEDAADRATMSANLAALVQAQWGIAWTGQPAQVRLLRRWLIRDSQAAQAIIADNTKTDNERFAAIVTLRRLDAISGYYKELSGK